MATVRIENGRGGDVRPVLRGFNGERWAIVRFDPDGGHRTKSWSLTHKGTGMGVAWAGTGKELALLKRALPLLEAQGELWDRAIARGSQPVELGEAWKDVRRQVWGF